ncbi:MAG: 50S ribosomal protein L22 [Planctomycetota bacterium]|jgi:large subunit ribosomal protein L22
MADAARTFRASHRWARIQPRKARLVATLVRGMPVNDAIAVLETSPQRGARLLRKVVRSALANASQDPEVDLNALVVSEARVDMGPLLGGRARWRPRAMGRATPIRKRTSHLLIGLSEATERRRRRQAKSEQEETAQSEAAE